jgi:two-component system KDP operon response regulator KdpE
MPDHILIIDDEIQIRRLLDITLSNFGYNISEASTGKEGLIKAAIVHPVLLFLIWVYPISMASKYLKS